MRSYPANNGFIVTFNANRCYVNNDGAVVCETLQGVIPPTTSLIAQSRSTNRFILSRLFGRVN